MGLEGEPVIPRAQGDIPADLVEVDDTCNQLIKFRVQDNILGQSPHYREEVYTVQSADQNFFLCCCGYAEIFTGFMHVYLSVELRKVFYVSIILMFWLC